MADLEKPPALSGYYQWSEVDGNGQLVPNKEGFETPAKKRIKFFNTDTQKEHTVHLTQDTGTKGIEWVLKYTLQDFHEFNDRFPLRDEAKYKEYRRFLVGPAEIFWDEVMGESPFNVPSTGQVDANFNLAITRYLEKVAGTTNVRDNLIWFLQDWKKPFPMSVMWNGSR